MEYELQSTLAGPVNNCKRSLTKT